MNNLQLTSLKGRIIASMVIIVTLTATMYAAGLLIIKQQLEESTFGEVVRDHLDALDREEDPRALLSHPFYADWRLFIGDEVDSLPEQIRRLPMGTHHSVRWNDRFFQLEKTVREGEVLVLMHDITDWEMQEHDILEAMAWGVLVVLGVALLLGAWSAQTILAPVRRLSGRVASAGPPSSSVPLAPDFQGSEIGQIAEAIDGYVERLAGFVEREQSFTAAASHELRTPLSIMMGAIDVLEAGDRAAEIQRPLDRLRRACNDMKAFIEATLFLSRESATMIDIEPTPLADIVESVLDDEQSALSGAGITLEREIDQAASIDAPHSIVKMLVANVVRNAIEHTGGGRISVRVAGRQLVIEDDGAGIPAADLDRVFDRDYSTKAGGVGLGLNLVRRICDRFNWKIVIESEAGKGTRVAIDLAGASP